MLPLELCGRVVRAAERLDHKVSWVVVGGALEASLGKEAHGLGDSAEVAQPPRIEQKQLVEREEGRG